MEGRQIVESDLSRRWRLHSHAVPKKLVFGVWVCAW